MLKDKVIHAKIYIFYEIVIKERAKNNRGSEMDNNILCYLWRNGHFLVYITTAYHRNFLYQTILRVSKFMREREILKSKHLFGLLICVKFSA